MEELNLKEAMQALKKKSKHILIIMIACAVLISLLSNVLEGDSYSSKVSIMVGSPEDFEKEQSVISNIDAVLNQQLVSNVEQLLKSNSVLDNVAQKAGGDVKTSDLKKDLKVKSVPSTSIIEIEYSSPTKEQTNKVLGETINEITNLTKKTMKKDNIQVVDAPNAKKKMKKLVNKTDIVVGLFLGFLIGIAYAFASYYKDPDIFSKEQLKGKLGLDTLSILASDYDENSKNALNLLHKRIKNSDNIGVFSYDVNTAKLAKAYNSNFDEKISAVMPIAEKQDLTEFTASVEKAIVLYTKDKSTLKQVEIALDAIKSLGIEPIGAVQVSQYKSEDSKYLPYA